MNALVLAGGKKEVFQQLGRSTMVGLVIQALRATPEISQVFLAAPQEEVEQSEESSSPLLEQIDAHFPSGETMIGTLENGIDGIQQSAKKSPESNSLQTTSAGAGWSSELLLVVAADLPLLSPQGVSHFVRSCQERKAHLYYSFVGKEDSESIFPGFPHTYVKLKNGSFCGGGIHALDPAAFPSIKELAIRLTSARKEPLSLARILGIKILLKFFTRSLLIEEVEERVLQLTGLPVAGIQSPFPEVAFNIDSREQLDYFFQHIKEGDHVSYDPVH